MVSRPSPSKVRLALLLVFAVYPLITALLYIVMPLTEGWALWQRTLVVAPLMVSSIVFGISPAIQKHFGWFVAPKPRQAR
ncbi:hypothetical protein LCM4573_07710 [Rhizobium sp. LCM 4573]|nr:hypothetical protein LCM4573_07710 [Rhizobium sp. LCM 4573]